MKTIIIGGVAGGAGACARLRRNDENMQLIMLERGEYISFANCGLPYYIGGVITDKRKLQVQTISGFSKRFNVDIRNFSEAIKLDKDLKRVLIKDHANNNEYWESYDKLVISVGSKPLRPPMPGVDLPHVFTLRNIPDTYAIKDYITERKVQRTVVIGGGFIGLEVAENLRYLGCEVHVIEANDHLVATMDKEVTAHLHNHIREKGVQIHLNSKVTEITADSVILADGTSIAAEFVLMSIGGQPDTAFLKDSGLELTARGEIVVNSYLQTNLPEVFAVGDAISHPAFDGTYKNIPLASPANKQARIVADNVCGKKVIYAGAQGTAILKVFDMVAAVTGDSEKALIRAGVEYRKSYTYSANHATYYPGSSIMFIKLLYTPEGVVLGAQIAGAEGVDKRIDVLATAVRNRLTVSQLAELELAYAPPFGAAKDPVNMAGYVAENVLSGRSKFFYPEDIERITDEDIVLDIRTQAEFDAGHFDQAIHIPLDQLRENLDKLDRKKKIYICCAIGLRGYLAQRLLMQHGFEKTYNLSGGFELYSVLLEDYKKSKR